ncbi:MAG: GntR family transcriptional regulator [Kiritimatiellae bacterium]|nr:GntR family transcriptional regulator [Kiritimatiellia bacterium]
MRIGNICQKKERPPISTAIPFTINRISSLTLVQQVVDGYRRAIASGRCRAGDILPSRMEMAEALGVSQRITREALSILRKEGLVEPRKGLGSIVLGAGAKVWKGRVLVAGPGKSEGSYYFNTLMGELGRRLVLSGYLVTRSSVMEGGHRANAFEALDAELRQPPDLIVTYFASPATFAHLADAGAPVVSVGMRVPEHSPCAGHVVIDFDGAVPDFVRRCRERGVRRVLRVGFAPDVICVDDALASEGIDVVDDILPKPGNVRPIEDAIRTALECFLSLDLSQEDLVLFTDDYLATGALLSLSARGVRIPEDIRIVTLANRGYGPVYFKTLARMEFDSKHHAAIIAQYLCRVLSRDTFPKVCRVSPRFMDGASFP